jgi:hypothetical protein
MPWPALVTGFLGLITAFVTGTILSRWIERREGQRRWERYRALILERLPHTLRMPYAYTPKFAQSLIVQLLAASGYIPQDLTDEVVTRAEAVLIITLYDLAWQSRQQGQEEMEDRALELLAALGEKVRLESTVPRMTGEVGDAESISTSVEEPS